MPPLRRCIFLGDMKNCFVTASVKVPVGANVLDVKDRLAKLLGILPCQIADIQLKKQSVDARKKEDVHFVCSYLVQCTKTPKRNAQRYTPPVNLLEHPQMVNVGSCIVVGSGPSGLFLARYLCNCGVRVTVVERGSDIAERCQKVQRFFDGGEFDSECNVQFGLGGAGTFSDGKLTTGISSPLTHTVFEEFVRAGAPKEILTSSLPHIGTDKLVGVVENMRNEIVRRGGKFIFDAFVDDLLEENGTVRGVSYVKEGERQTLFADCVALCCGHSAREMFVTLQKHGAEMQFKPFAVGLRVEHPREFINKAQYGEIFATHRDLGAASYKLVNNMGERSCYSFCMCPGGTVVCANSTPNTVVVNGMSNFARAEANSNSALVVTVTANDVADWGFGDDSLAGIRFQEKLEKDAYLCGKGNYVAPCQNVTDFVADTKTAVFDVAPSYPRGVVSADLRRLLPRKISDAIVQSLHVFGQKMKSFDACGVLTGVETRTSSPVKVVRDENMQSNLKHLYPVGEGCGHSGGIVSSAVDGLKVAQAIAQFLLQHSNAR